MANRDPNGRTMERGAIPRRRPINTLGTRATNSMAPTDDPHKTRPESDRRHLSDLGASLFQAITTQVTTVPTAQSAKYGTWPHVIHVTAQDVASDPAMPQRIHVQHARRSTHQPLTRRKGTSHRQTFTSRAYTLLNASQEWGRTQEEQK